MLNTKWQMVSLHVQMKLIAIDKAFLSRTETNTLHDKALEGVHTLRQVLRKQKDYQVGCRDEY